MHTPPGTTDSDGHPAALTDESEGLMRVTQGPVPGLPLPVLPALPNRSTLSALSAFYCAVTPLDARGRLADSSPVRIAGLSPGQPITITTNLHPRTPHTG